MKSQIFFISFVLSTLGMACGAHPGITHEEWSSQIKTEMNEDGRTYQSLSSGFFDSKPSTQAPAEGRDEGSRNSQRPYSDN